MKSDLERAVLLLKADCLTLAAVCGDVVVTSRERGVKPLLELLDSGRSLSGFSAADKVIGKAAAFLYVLLNVDCIHAGIISRPALEVLMEHGIPAEYDVLTDAVRNRTNTGFCPMETTVMETASPEKALELIQKKLTELRGGVS